MSLMFFFPFDETSRGDFVFLDDFFCFMSLMTVFFNDLLFEFRTISSSLALNGETRVTISAKKPLWIISAVAIFFGIFAFAVDTILHQFCLQNKKYFFTCVAFISKQKKMSSESYSQISTFFVLFWFQDIIEVNFMIVLLEDVSW